MFAMVDYMPATDGAECDALSQREQRDALNHLGGKNKFVLKFKV